MTEKQKKSFFENLFGNEDSQKSATLTDAKSESVASSTVKDEDTVKDLSELSIDAENTVAKSSSDDFSHSQETTAAESEISAPTAADKQFLDGQDYAAALTDFNNHQHKYQSHKKQYEKIFSEYENSRENLVASLNSFSPSSQSMRDVRNIYTKDISDYKVQIGAYEAFKSNYFFARSDIETLETNLTKANDDFDAAQAHLTEITAEAKEKAKFYVDSLDLSKELDTNLKTAQNDLDTMLGQVEEVEGTYNSLSQVYEVEKPKFDEAKEEYDYASNIKKDYTQLTLQVEQMDIQEQTAKGNYDTIKAVLDDNKNKLEVAESINDFSQKPISNTRSEYDHAKKAFDEVEVAYGEIKERYDQESANYSRIKLNYDTLSKDENANRVALHYVGEEFRSAQESLDELTEKFRPVEQDYKNKKAVYDVLSTNFIALSAMSREAEKNYKDAQKVVNESQLTFDKVSESYDYVQTQNGILKQNLASKEAQYKEVEPTYDEVSRHYEEIRTTFEPLDADYQEALRAYDGLHYSIDQKREEIARLTSLDDQAHEALQAATEALSASKSSLEEQGSKLQDFQATIISLNQQYESASQLAKINYTNANEKYSLLAVNYQDLSQNYQEFVAVHTVYDETYRTLSSDYDRTASLFRLANDEFSKISQAYDAYVDHSDQVSALYEDIMSKYIVDKEYHDKVYAEYQKVQEARSQVLARKFNFDAAADILKALLVQKNALTFPIYEATGQNYMDTFNIPEIDQTARDTLVLHDKPQLHLWLTTFDSAREKLATTADGLSDALNSYQAAFDSYRQAGGERLASIEDKVSPYQGIDLSTYFSKLDAQVTAWKNEYTLREEAFTPVIRSYMGYIGREEQLLKLLSNSGSSQESVQSVINLINAIPEYSDIYSPAYGNLDTLATYLGLPSIELTQPKSPEDLKKILDEHYYRRISAIIKSNIPTFIQNLRNFKSNYEESIDSLKKALAHFSVTTGISTSNIEISSILIDDPDLEGYLQMGLRKNYEALLSQIIGISSLVNIFKKSHSLVKVANRTLDVSANTTIVLPDKPIQMTQELLNTSFEIFDLKVPPIPIQPDKPAEMAQRPNSPSRLPDKPEYIELGEEPVRVESLENA